MCKFENQLLLCTCENNSTDTLFSWKIVRKKNEKPAENFSIIGQITIPEEYKNLTAENFDGIINNMIEFGISYKERQKQLNNTIINIKTELNTRYCFDKKINFMESDILSILIDSEYTIWANFIYDKSEWKIFDSFIDYDIYAKI
jgi:hypothetical protein